MTSDAHLARGNRLHVPQHLPAVPLDRLDMLHGCQVLPGRSALRELLEHAPLPLIRGVVRVADLQGGARHGPVAGFLVLPGDARRLDVTDIDRVERAGFAHGRGQVTLQCLGEGFDDPAGLSHLHVIGRVGGGRSDGQCENRQERKMMQIFHDSAHAVVSRSCCHAIQPAC